jgi:hypothetical protein
MTLTKAKATYITSVTYKRHLQASLMIIIKMFIVQASFIPPMYQTYQLACRKKWRLDKKRNDTQDNDIQHDYSQINTHHIDIQHNDTKHYNTLGI